MQILQRAGSESELGALHRLLHLLWPRVAGPRALPRPHKQGANARESLPRSSEALKGDVNAGNF